jgi:hypothetical protein
MWMGLPKRARPSSPEIATGLLAFTRFFESFIPDDSWITGKQEVETWASERVDARQVVGYRG